MFLRRACAPALVALLATLALARSSQAATSLTMEIVPGSRDVLLRWETDAAGPVDILRATAHGGRPGLALPLDPATTTWRRDVTGSSLVLPNEADLPLAPFQFERARVYQIVDASGGCSNAGFVATRALAGPLPDPAVLDLVVVPPRGTVRDARSLLTTSAAVRKVGRWLAAECRWSTLEVAEDGSIQGANFSIGPGDAIRVAATTPVSITLVGAAEPSGDIILDAAGGSGCSPDRQVVGLPWASPFRDVVEVACGERGVAWQDLDGDGIPDTCLEGLLDDANLSRLTVERDDLAGRVEMGFARTSHRARLDGVTFPLNATAGLRVTTTRRDGTPPRLDAMDRGATDACRCADTDGDGEDDCSERLFGSDPSDPASHGPDRDGDGVRDHRDACPADANPLQEDADADGLGDACDPCPSDASNACVDPDGDGRVQGDDNCPGNANAGQEDEDDDLVGDPCDACPEVPDDQHDTDRDGVGDACDPCPATASPDADRDGSCDDVDNCPGAANADQADGDGDGFGDACDCDLTGAPLPEVRDFRVEADFRIGSFIRRLSWTDDAPAVGPGVRYDVVSGSIEDLVRERGFWTTECLLAGSPVAAMFEAFVTGNRWYLAAMRSACNPGGWGHSAGPRPVPDARELLAVRAPCP